MSRHTVWRILKRLWRFHKTKVTGLLTVIAGAAQASSGHLQAVIEPSTYGLMMFALGIWVAVLGFLNSHQQKPE